MTHDWVIGLHGCTLTAAERQQLRQSPPLGVILFARNVQDAAQVAALLDDVRQHTGQATWAAIDEEGGRIHRMPFPPFNGRRSAYDYGIMYRNHPHTTLQALYEDNLNTAQALKRLGFSHNCAPVLDLFHPQAHAIIGNRAYSEQLDDVIALAAACMRGLHDGGIAAIGKHYPGHGRATADSHGEIPVVAAPAEDVMHDAAVFDQLVQQGLAHVMTAHIRYTALDANIATFSPFWLQRLRNQGFTGTIWSDDLCMKGAGEDVNDAIQQARQAGCNALLICQPEAVTQAYAYSPSILT